MGNGFEGDTYGGAATNIEIEIERRIEMKRQRVREGEQFSVSFPFHEGSQVDLIAASPQF